MSVAPTNAARIMEQRADELSSYQVISLLLAGAMERVSQAKTCVREGNEADKAVLMAKLIGIINGLRQSLDMRAGGDIATNLDILYNYMSERLSTCSGPEEMIALSEVGKLIDNVKQGWDAIDKEG
ncbi:flagellar export chaperone FliS [Teredinibacter purpureus]|uniref:flagellar export chaperone FliS n=1 Tax=Teredinibacter purpureus TaxID=2731756 RepID=UPI0005F7EAFD|nr:flagellar export chaperone FliS [Teredinibacter purpureus]